MKKNVASGASTLIKLKTSTGKILKSRPSNGLRWLERWLELCTRVRWACAQSGPRGVHGVAWLLHLRPPCSGFTEPFDFFSRALDEERKESECRHLHRLRKHPIAKFEVFLAIFCKSPLSSAGMLACALFSSRLAVSGCAPSFHFSSEEEERVKCAKASLRFSKMASLCESNHK